MAWSADNGTRHGRDASVAEHQTLGLAARRLSIIDLSPAGAQPMSTADGRYWVAYNGEVYNYLELRSELEANGCVFRSTSDTEVVLEALVTWGRSALTRFAGMFALAFFDTRDGRLLLARDHFGMKPLYIVQSSDGLFFASEINPLMRHLSPAPKINANRALEYLRFGRIDEFRETIVDGIENLQAGHTILIDIPGRSIGRQESFWKLSIPRPIDVSFDEAASITREKFLKNIELHLRSDVPVGACLSGGLDSSACVAAMRYVKGSALDLHTFTYSARNERIDESKWAYVISSTMRTQAHEATASAEDLNAELDELIRLQGEPFATTSIYAQQLVFRLIARNGVKVVLDGQGADEMLGGYPLFFAIRIAGAIRQGKLGEAIALIHSARRKGGFAQAPFVAAQYLLPAKLQEPLRRAIGRELVPRWMNEEWLPKRSPPRVFDVDPAEILKVELRASLSGTLRALLRYEDRNSMAVSVESRLPYLTVDLVEFLLSLPESFLIAKDGTTKAVFRRAMEGIVPDAILERKDKISFQTPEVEWLRQLSQWANTVLQSEEARSCPIVNFAEAERQWGEAMKGSRPYQAWMWRWLNLIRWAQINSVSWPRHATDRLNATEAIVAGEEVWA